MKISKRRLVEIRGQEQAQQDQVGGRQGRYLLPCWEERQQQVDGVRYNSMGLAMYQPDSVTCAAAPAGWAGTQAGGRWGSHPPGLG